MRDAKANDAHRSLLSRADLANDYEDFAASIQGLGYLESGITEPLARLETSMLDFAQSLRTAVSKTVPSSLCCHVYPDTLSI